MKFQAIFKARDFTDNIQDATYDWKVERFSVGAVGGPQEAAIATKCADYDLTHLKNYLRRPVEIYDELGRCAWWGYVNEVLLSFGMTTVSLRLDEMANSIDVKYVEQTTGQEAQGVPARTGWGSNQVSLDEYGVKELILSSSNANNADAAAEIQTKVLAERQYPIQGVSIAGNMLEPTGAKVICKGWWSTLDWRYAVSAANELIFFKPGGATDSALIGYDNNTVRFNQCFTVGTVGITATSVTGHYKINGTATDNVQVSIQADSSGTPSGTALASLTFDPSVLTSTGFVDHTHPFATPGTLSASTKYWMVWARSGAVSSSNFVRMGVNVSTPYTGGSALYYTSGATWVTRTWDVYFAINGAADSATTKQISDMINQYGQFIGTSNVENASGINASGYREGEERAQAVVESLLGQGVASGNRLLANIDRNRNARIYAADSNTTITYLMDRKGELTTLTGGLVDKHLVRPGVWVQLRDIPGVGANSVLANISTFFIESVEYDAQADQLYITPQTTKSAMDISGLSEVR